MHRFFLEKANDLLINFYDFKANIIFVTFDNGHFIIIQHGVQIILLHFRAFEPTPPSVSRMAPESFFPCVLLLCFCLLSCASVACRSPGFRLMRLKSLSRIPLIRCISSRSFAFSSLSPRFRDFAACIRSHRSMRSILRFQFPDNWLPALPAGGLKWSRTTDLMLIRHAL